MKTRILILFLFLVLVLLTLPFGFAARATPHWIDSSHDYLLPKQVSRQLSMASKFPLFWWNFIVLEVRGSGSAPADSAWSHLDAFCHELNTATAKTLVLQSACGEDLTQFHDLVFDWAADQVRRDPPPADREIKTALDDAIAKASLPGDPFLLGVLRADPLSSFLRLRGLMEKNGQIQLKKVHGYFFDSETRRVVIPVQLGFQPSQTEMTKQFFAKLGATLRPWTDLRLLGVVGPQASTLENEQQVFSDVKIISVIGLLLLALQAALAILAGRWKLLFLIPPVLVSTAAAAIITYILFGQIHGLTLSFGPGIVGLAMDHGLHSCLNTRWRGAWKANWYGLLTTVVALFAMLFSEIPFLRQLMAFSIIGLFLGFFTYWFLHRRFASFFRVKPLAINPTPRPLHYVLLALAFVGLVVGGLKLKPNFGMRQMNFQTDAEKELSTWLVSHLKSRTPLLEIYGAGGESPFPQALHHKQFAAREGLQVQTVASFLPDVDVQATHIGQWQKICAMKRSHQEDVFFAPFWQTVCRVPRPVPTDLSERTPSYLKDLRGGDEWISMWMPRDATETSKVKAEFPGAKSFIEIVDLFQVIIEHEVVWMAPLAMLLAAALLWNYYRRAYLVALSLVPFFVGLGFFFGLATVFHFQLSFISLIAVVMIFGLSLDYGIFATNLYTGIAGPSPQGVWTSVVLAALVTFLGFLPMLFCHHPVLVQLGQALVYGTAGTIFGSFWGIPCIATLHARILAR